MQRFGWLAVLAGEHQLEQGRIARGEADVGGRGGPQPRREVFAPVDGALELGPSRANPASAGAPELVKRTDAAKDSNVARRLWDVSEQLTGAQFPLGASAAV